MNGGKKPMVSHNNYTFMTLLKTNFSRWWQLSHNVFRKVISSSFFRWALCRQIQTNKVLSTSRPHSKSYTLLKWGQFGERSVCVTCSVHTLTHFARVKLKHFPADLTRFDRGKVSAREAARHLTARGDGGNFCVQSERSSKKTAGRAITGMDGVQSRR